MYRIYNPIALVGAAAMAAQALGMPACRYEVVGWSRPGTPSYRNRNNGSIAGAGHENKREIARRQRQKHRQHTKYMLNGGFTRRGAEAGPLA